MKRLKYFKFLLHWIYLPLQRVEPIDEEKYYTSFGLSKVIGEFIIKDKQKLENAYKKAWDNRDFEINKFWTRASYFWGFIALIFGAYLIPISVLNYTLNV